MDGALLIVLSFLSCTSPWCSSYTQAAKLVMKKLKKKQAIDGGRNSGGNGGGGGDGDGDGGQVDPSKNETIGLSGKDAPGNPSLIGIPVIPGRGEERREEGKKKDNKKAKKRKEQKRVGEQRTGGNGGDASISGNSGANARQRPGSSGDRDGNGGDDGGDGIASSVKGFMLHKGLSHEKGSQMACT